MKQRIAGIFAVLALMLALSSPSPARERHPEIRAALDALRNARAHLVAAAHDYHGHKADAIRATDEAIHQLQVCLEFD